MDTWSKDSVRSSTPKSSRRLVSTLMVSGKLYACFGVGTGSDCQVVEREAVNAAHNSPSFGAALAVPDIQAERLHFLDEDVEGLGRAGFEIVVTLDDRLVNPRASLDVVGFDGEEFLQGVGGAVCFQRPHFHFPEALAAVLGLAAERLLGDEAVGADGAGVDLVRDQVAEFEHIDDAD